MSLPDIRPCVGKCGRSTRPAMTSLEKAPGTVIRYKENMCANCWEFCQAMRPMTRQEAAVLTSLEAWNRRRARRQYEKTRRELWVLKQHQMAEREKRGDNIEVLTSGRTDRLEQAAEEPVFKTLRASSAYKRLKDSQDPDMNERVEKNGDGVIRYLLDSRGEWRFSVVGANGEVMAQSEAYVSLRNAKRGAKRLAERLAEKEKPSE